MMCYTHLHLEMIFRVTQGRLKWCCLIGRIKVKGFPYSLPSIGPGADPSVHAVSPQTKSFHVAV